MAVFRYAQQCPFARATEILGERWTLLLVRELLLSPKRFIDLKGRLPGISASVLTDRLARLEDCGLLGRRELPPPAASTVYELTPHGRALGPAMRELARWGVRFLHRSRPDDHFEPEWVVQGLATFARDRDSPDVALAVRITDTLPERTVYLRGGADGTQASEVPCPVQATLAGPAATILQIAIGATPPAAAIQAETLRVDGDRVAVDQFPGLFELDFLNDRPLQEHPDR